MKKGILLVNLGTPRSPKVGDVRRYLNEFLTDRRVIDVPWLWRQVLVRGIITPFRAKSSAKSYKEIWTEEGSPLLVWGKKVKRKLQESLGSEYHVELAMRYQEPSIASGLRSLRGQNVDSLIVLPLFPQYASATTGSVIEKVLQEMKKEWEFPRMRVINHFYDNPAYIDAVCATAKGLVLPSYDHTLFSFHGLPERQLRKCNRFSHCLTPHCCQDIEFKNHSCYGAQCHATARIVAQKLSILNYSVTFQSRLGRDPWLKPYTSDRLKELRDQGAKRLLVFSPSFVCDCLETTFEIGTEYCEEFQEMGGETLDLVPGLNAHPQWISALSEMVSR